MSSTLTRTARNAIDELLRKLSCPKCNQLMRDPYYLPRCDHSFCRHCIKTHLAKTSACPQCNNVTWVKDARPNKLLKDVIEQLVKIQEAFAVVAKSAESDSEDKGNDACTREMAQSETLLDESGKEAQRRADKRAKVDIDLIESDNKNNGFGFVRTSREAEVSSVDSLLNIDSEATPSTQDISIWRDKWKENANLLAEVDRDIIADRRTFKDRKDKCRGSASSTQPNQNPKRQRNDEIENLQSKRKRVSTEVKTSSRLKQRNGRPEETEIRCFSTGAENLNVVAQANAKEKASIIIMTTGLPPKLKQDVNQYVAKLAGATLVTSWNCQQQPTHLLTVTQQKNGQRRCKRTLKYLEAVARGIWVVDIRWLKACIQQECHVPEDAYEVEADILMKKIYGPRRARKSTNELAFQLTTLTIGTGEKHYLKKVAEIAQLCGAKVLYGCQCSTSSVDKQFQNNLTIVSMSNNRNRKIVLSSNCRSQSKTDNSYATQKRVQSLAGVSAVRATWILDCVSCFELLDDLEYKYKLAIA